MARHVEPENEAEGSPRPSAASGTVRGLMEAYGAP
jgi:hypothetical protein